MSDRASITTDTSGLGQTTAEHEATAHERRATVVKVLTGVLALLVTFGVAEFVPQVGDQLALSFTRRPTTGTELYFVDPETLPRTLQTGAANPVEFAVVNHERQTVTYHWIVSATSSVGPVVVAQGDVTVKAGAEARIAASFTPDTVDTTYVISASLAGRSEQIRFRGRT